MSADIKNKTPIKRHWLKKLFITGLALLGAIVLVTGSGMLWLNSSGGHRYVADYVSDTLSNPDLIVKIGDLSGSIYSQLRIADITVADRQGVWLTVPRLDLEWAPFDLVNGDLTIVSLGGEGIAAERLPEMPAVASDEAGSPAATFLKKIDVGALGLKGSFTGIPFELDASDLIVSGTRFGGAMSLLSVFGSDKATIEFSKIDYSSYNVQGDILLVPGGLISALTDMKLAARSAVSLSAIITAKDDLSLTYQLSTPGMALEAASISNAKLIGQLTAVPETGYESKFGFSADAIVGDDKALSPVNLAGLVSVSGGSWSANFDQVEVGDYAVDSFLVGGFGGQVLSAEGSLLLNAEMLSNLTKNQIIAGSVPVSISLTHQSDQLFGFNADVTGSDIAYANEGLTDLLGASPTVIAAGTVNALGDVTITESTLTAGQIDADLSGTYSGETRQINLLIEAILDQAVLEVNESIEASSGLAITLNVSGAATAPNISVATKPLELIGYGTVLSDAVAQVTIAPSDAAGLTGNFSITATSSAGPVALKSPFTFGQNGLNLPSITLETAIASAAGAAAWNETDGPSGRFDIALKPIESGGLSVAGAAEANLILSSQAGVLSGEMTLSGSDITVVRSGDFPFYAETLLGSATLTMDGGAPQIKANVSIEDIGHGAKTISSITILGDTRAQDPIIIAANGNWGQAFDLDLRWQTSASSASVSGSLTYGVVNMSTRSPITLSFNDGLGISVKNLAINDGQIAGDVLWQNGALTSLNMDMIDISHSLMDSVAPGLIDGGLISGSVQLGSVDNQLIGEARLALKDLSFVSTGRFAKDTLYASDLRLALDGETASLTGSIFAGDQQAGTVAGKLPLEISADLTSMSLAMETAFEAEIDWSGDVTPLWSVVKRPGHQLSGRFNGNLKAVGTLADPSFDGTLALTDGRYEYAPLAFTATIDTLLVRGTQDYISLESLVASDGEGGSLEGSGRFDLKSGMLFPGEMNVKMQDFHVARLNTISSTASADITYLRSPGGNSLTGRIETGPTTFQIPKELPVSIVDIEVTEINKPNTVAAKAADRFGGSAERFVPTNLDINLTVPRRFVLSGRGLYSEWTGQLRLTGNTDDPRLLGQLQLGQGYFDFGSKRFTFIEGLLSFGGLRGFDPILALKAEYESPTIKAMMSIDGRATALTFELTSEPSLPEDEILSRVLIGKSVTDLDVLQLAELAAAAQSLRGSNFDAIGSVRKSLGLDTLSVSNSASEDGGALVTGGKYLSNNIYLEVETSPSSSETATRLRIDLTKRFLLETEVGPRQGNSLYLKWFWDY